jgi:hypothetical protein
MFDSKCTRLLDFMLYGKRKSKGSGWCSTPHLNLPDMRAEMMPLDATSASAMVVLPWSTWARMQMLRMADASSTTFEPSWKSHAEGGMVAVSFASRLLPAQLDQLSSAQLGHFSLCQVSWCQFSRVCAPLEQIDRIAIRPTDRRQFSAG